MMTKLLRLLLVAPLVGGAPLLAQTVPPGDNLVTDGVPPVPASIAEAARRYSEFRSAAFWDWHPTRREMLVGTRFGDAQQQHRVRLPGGAFAPLDWSPDDRTLLLHQAISVNESYLWLADVATGVKTLLTRPGTDTVAYGGGGAQFSRDGKGIYLTTDQGSEVRRLAYLELLGKRYRFLSDRPPWDVDEFAL